MKTRSNFTGIGRIYQGSVYLAEVLYDLRPQQGSAGFSNDLTGHILILEGMRAQTFSAPKTLCLEDGRTIQITLEDGDTRVGKYAVHGTGKPQ